MVANNIIKGLQDIGLSKYEATAFYHLSRRPAMTGNELAEVSSLPRGRIYDVLKALVTRGFCIENLGERRTFSAVDPDVALAKLKAEAAARREEFLASLEAVIGPLTELFAEGQKIESPQSFIRIIREPRQLIKEEAGLFEEGAVKELMVFARDPFPATAFGAEPGPGAQDPLYQRWRRSIKKSFKNALDGQIIVDLSYFPEDRLAKFLPLVMPGMKVRLAKRLPCKMRILDRRRISLLLPRHLARDQKWFTLFIDHPELGGALAELFQFYWKAAKAVPKSIKPT